MYGYVFCAWEFCILFGVFLWGVASAFSGGGGSHVGVLVRGRGAGGAGGGAPVFLGGIGGACLHKPGWAE